MKQVFVVSTRSVRWFQWHTARRREWFDNAWGDGPMGDDAEPGRSGTTQNNSVWPIWADTTVVQCLRGGQAVRGDGGQRLCLARVGRTLGRIVPEVDCASGRIRPITVVQPRLERGESDCCDLCEKESNSLFLPDTVRERSRSVVNRSNPRTPKRFSPVNSYQV